MQSALAVYRRRSCDFATVIAASLYAIGQPFFFLPRYALRLPLRHFQPLHGLHDLRLSLTRLFDLS